MTDFRSHPDPSEWDNYVDFESTSWPKKDRRNYWIIPSICFNCESACGILAYVDKETLDVRKIEGNPVHPGSRGRTCAKGVVTPNQLEDPDRVLYPLRRVGERGEGRWQRVTWDEVLEDIGGRIRRAIVEGRRHELMYHVGRPGEDGYANRVLQAWGVDGHNSHTNVCSSSARLAHFLWTGADRPVAGSREREDDPAAVVAPRVGPLLQPARAAHHRRQVARREADRDRPAAVEHVGEGRPVAAGESRHRGRAAARDGAPPHRHEEVQPRVRAALGELGRVSRGVPAGAAAHVRSSFETALKDEYARFTPEYAEAETGVPAAQDHRGRRRDRGGGDGVFDAQLARRGGRPPVGLADHALPVSARRADGRDRRDRAA